MKCSMQVTFAFEKVFNQFVIFLFPHLFDSLSMTTNRMKKF